MGILAGLWRLLANLVRDLASLFTGEQTYDEEQPREDDVLDAWGDDDGIDATGL